MNAAAAVVGGLRCASGVSFLVDPVKANQMWGDRNPTSPTARLLLRSMGYRDALIGGLLLTSAVRGRDTRGWFLAGGGADLADLVGGLSVHDELDGRQKIVGLGGAAVGIAVALWGATRR